VVLVVIISLIVGATKGGSSGGSGTSGGSSSVSGGSGGSTDPIEQARVVLSANYGESYTYDSIKSITDTALSNMGEAVNNDRRSRAWSAVLAVLKQPELANVSPMDVMRCVATDDGGAAKNAGMSFSDMVAICAVTLG